MASPQVKTERHGRVLVIELDNPPRNFMTQAMTRELDELTRSLARDRTIGAAVVTGAPEGIFITHYDVSEIVQGGEGGGAPVSIRAARALYRAVGGLARLPGLAPLLERTPADGLLQLRRGYELQERINAMDKVFIAAINGLALGGGFELALACDLRYIADDDQARVGQPEVAVGIIPGAGGTQRIARMLGPARALELVLEARALTPREAYELGLVQRLIAPERLLEEALETAERLARRGPMAIAAAKRAIYDGPSPMAPGMRLEAAGFIAAASQKEALRAMESYLEDVASLGDEPLYPSEEFFGPWRDGTRVDLVS